MIKKKAITTYIGPFYLDNGKIANTKLKMTEISNDYFAFIFTVEEVNEIQEITPAQVNLIITFSDCKFTEEVVSKSLDIIQVNITLGPDYIAPRVSKQAKYKFSRTLAILFNKSLNSGGVPDICKKANVTPTQKKGGRTLTVNYRSIILITVVGKLMESIICDKLVSFLKENMINNTQQYFRSLPDMLAFYNDIF